MGVKPGPFPSSLGPDGRRGTVYLVGAGPGDAELITVRGARLLGRADVVVYDGLANATLLDLAPVAAERIYAGKKHSERGQPLTQAQIDALLIDRARRGHTVVRLKGGDPFVFGRGGEEAEALAQAGVPFEIVPGVTAATAVPAYAGIPLTHRAVASSVVALATGQEGDGRPPEDTDWDAIARADTIVLFMAVKTLGVCAARLQHAGRPATTPVAVIRWGTTAAQRTVVGTLGDIAARVQSEALRPPALVVVGDVVRLRDRLAWFERRPLLGARVLVPRQKEQARAFAAQLAELGAEPVVAEVTRLRDVDPRTVEAELRSLPGAYDWIAFTSQNAVERTFDALARLGLDARRLGGVRVAAVGAATAQALRQRGVIADVVPARGDGTAVAETMAAADPSIDRARVLLPRAAEGREELALELATRGAQVAAVAVYRTAAAPAAELEPVLARLRAGELDVLTFFAPSQVAAIAEPLGDGSTAILNRARLIAAIGGTTAEALRARGIRVDLVPGSPSADALAAELAARYPTAHPGGT